MIPHHVHNVQNTECYLIVSVVMGTMRTMEYVQHALITVLNAHHGVNVLNVYKFVYYPIAIVPQVHSTMGLNVNNAMRIVRPAMMLINALLVMELEKEYNAIVHWVHMNLIVIHVYHIVQSV